MKSNRYKNGFTLVELLVALIVSSVILTAVATLAYAMSSANDATDDTSQKQTQLRYATLRLSELIRHSKLVCGLVSGGAGNDLAVWRADDNGDGYINPPELVYIETGIDRDYIRLLEFFTDLDWLKAYCIDPDVIPNGFIKMGLKMVCDERYTTLVPQCSDVEFGLDAQPLQTSFVTVSFDLTENDTVHRYEITAGLRGWAANLIDDSGDIVDGDDD